MTQTEIEFLSSPSRRFSILYTPRERTGLIIISILLFNSHLVKQLFFKFNQRLEYVWELELRSTKLKIVSIEFHS